MASIEESELLAEARKRFSIAKDAWSEIREEMDRDLKMVSGDQWDPAAKAARENSGRPALTDNRLHTEVQQVTNRARQERPQPKVNPSDDEASEATAEMLEGHFRHIQYASQADVAYDGAVESSASCGFGAYRITTEYLNDKSNDQEPRIKRILDPKTVYFDPDCQEPDFSDAMYCFIRKRMNWDDYRRQYGTETSPTDFEGDDATLKDWGDREHVCVAEYWYVTKTKRKDKELGRDIEECRVDQCIIDGARVLEETEWLGRWIPIIPVLGKEMVVEGKRQLISLVRFARDPQKLLNAYESGIAENLALSTRAPWIGYKGQFKDKKWQTANSASYSYLEVEPVTIAGAPAPLPQRNQFEAPIQALSGAAMQQIDAIKASFGYVDNITRPSQADISGIAVMRRSDQQSLTNFHYEDNLIRSQWHAGRVLLDLIQKLYDNPRSIRTMAQDGQVGLAAITRADENGEAQAVPGMEGQPHHRLDLGSYDVTITVGPSYNTKREEEAAMVQALLQADPQLWTTFGDLLFKIMGYQDLEERAKMLLPPAIQQAQQAKQQGIPPAIQAKMAQLMQENALFKQAAQKLISIIQTKQVEQQGKLEVERLKTAGAVTVETIKQRHEFDMAHAEDVQEAIKHMMDLMHESELGATPGPGMGNNAVPQPAGPGGATQ